MTNYRPIDSKREEFRKYLERCGVLDVLTKVLSSLYEESDKVPDAMEYVRKSLLENSPGGSVEEEMKAQISALTEENSKLRERLGRYEEVQPSPLSQRSPVRSTDENASGKVGSQQSGVRSSNSNRSAPNVNGG